MVDKQDFDVYYHDYGRVFDRQLVVRWADDVGEYSSFSLSMFSQRIRCSFDRIDATVKPPVREIGKPMPYEVAALMGAASLWLSTAQSGAEHE